MEKVKTGTTTLSLLGKDFVVIGADQKSSMGYLISSKNMKKVFQVSDTIAMTIAGTAADGQALARLLSAELKIYKMQEGEVTLRTATMLLSTILRSAYKSYAPEMVQLIVSGYDKRGPHTYSIDLAGGLEESGDYTFTGSGSLVAVGVLEDNYNKNMTQDESVDLIIRALMAARERDMASGGELFNIAIISKDKFEWLTEDVIRSIVSKKLASKKQFK
ncbi:MAG: proteasome subunit beta [DPANN group archaeon]|nr:proteasome subunit beta [DPANN group archaeon]